MAMLKSDGKMVFMIFIGVIITAVFLVTISDSVFLQTNTPTIANLSVTVPAVNTTLAIQLPGRQNVTIITALNGSETFTNNFSVNTTDSSGNLGVFWFPTEAAATEGIVGGAVNLSYTYQPFGGIRSIKG